MELGIIGLGAIGKIVAGKLIEAGLHTTVWNRSPEPVTELVALGAVGTKNVQEALQNDVVLSFLFDDSAVKQVFLESNVLGAAPAGMIHVCMSTISTDTVQELIQAHKDHKVEYVAAPFLGRPEAAAEAKLNMMTAGAPEILDEVEPVLRLLGKTWRMGHNPQAGHLAKIAGNFLLGCAIEGMQESAALIASQGGDPALFLAMMGETLLSAPVYRINGPKIALGDFKRDPEALRIAQKDIGLALDEAESREIQIPFAEVLQKRLRQSPTR